MTPDDLSDRLLGFAVRTVHLAESLPDERRSSRRVCDQLVRSATSVGANYEEARAAESRDDFVHKAQISLKELRESRYWIRVAIGTGLVEPSLVASLLQECEELVRILAKSVVTAKRNATATGSRS